MSKECRKEEVRMKKAVKKKQKEEELLKIILRDIICDLYGHMIISSTNAVDYMEKIQKL